MLVDEIVVSISARCGSTGRLAVDVLYSEALASARFLRGLVLDSVELGVHQFTDITAPLCRAHRLEVLDPVEHC